MARLRARNANRSIAEVFEEIYRKQLWGGSEDGISSGAGSSQSVAEPYANAVREFIRARGVRSVLDIGCGDFRVGALLRMDGVRYVGVDIVEDVVRRNSARFANGSTTFICRNALVDDLPPADLCLVRQVLQHLSNQEIAALLGRLSNYPHVLITEHLPPPGSEVRPNIDKPHGSDTRVSDGSGVFLDLPPFNLPIETVVETRLEPALEAHSPVLRTVRLVRAEAI